MLRESMTPSFWLQTRGNISGKLRWLESKNRLHIGVGWGDIGEIENLNILGATQAAKGRAVESVFESAQIEPHEPDPLFADVGSNGTGGSDYLSSWRIFVDGKR